MDGFTEGTEMIKTPEQMAEEFRKAWGDEQLYKVRHEHKRFDWGDALVDGFLAGYQAAKPQWISVYERLPEEGVKVRALINYVLEGKTIREVVEASLKNWLWSGRGVHITHPLVSHWMPLPTPPEE